MPPAELNELKSIPGLAERLAASGTARQFSEGEVILDENMRIRAIPFVRKGSVRVIRRDEDGRELLLYNIRSGESCIMSLLGGLHNETSKVVAVAEEPTEVVFLPIDQMTALIRENPDLLNYIFRLY
ncbi:MAG: cyclic nucleotide-binding domain-containing protein, partial [Cyclobacteriaceae bacterium]|nr:cyclic nucleotide-binding domain-containing protein [Cyclobacteriaceae bacterium]